MDIVIVGGCGRVGFPLGLAFADRGLRVTLLDIDVAAVAAVNAGDLPFEEPGAGPVFRRVLGEGFAATTDPAVVAEADTVLVVIGTPVDRYLNPDSAVVPKAVSDLGPYLRDGQLLVLRSTVYPGVTAMVEEVVAKLGLNIDVAFCPERIAQGKAMTELFEIPQLVGARTSQAADRAEKLFRRLATQIIHLEPEEAELAKLFTNTWRYIKFAAANQLYMIANDFGLDYERIRSAVVADYPRAAGLPKAGFAAGPCLFKDTMQLAAFNNNNFTLGHVSMMINEGLPLYVLSRLEQRTDLSAMTVGILGMAFKAESDDTRASLSYKLRKILKTKAADVMCADPYVTGDPTLVPVADVVERADLIIIGVPHQVFGTLDLHQPVVDIWGLLDGGVRV